MISGRRTHWLTVVLLGLGLSGCASRPVSPPNDCTKQTREIARLQQSLAEKDSEIRRLHTHQEARIRELEETNAQAARAEVKLRRFSTEADAASRLAEAEVALQTLRSKPQAGDSPVQALAHQLLDKASAYFRQGEYGEAVNLAVQARQLVDMLLARHALAGGDASPAAAFRVAIPLRIKTDTRLRAQPGTHADTIEVLPPATPVVALGRYGLWLQIQAPERNTGWVSSELVELP